MLQNRITLLKQLIPGLLPLIVFIIADEIWGTKVGLIVAIGIGIVELVTGFLKGEKPDKFILLDLGLIISMGAVSLWLENDFFFKMKPVLLGFILCFMLGFAIFLPGDFLFRMTKRYMKGIEIDPWQHYEFKRSLKVFFVLIAIHTLITLAVTIWGSTRWWGIVSGPGFFVLFCIYFLFEVIRKRRQAAKYRRDEWLPLVNKDGKVLGQAPRSVVHSGSRLLHPVVHMHVIDHGKIYLQKRQAGKLIQPGKWDTAVGGHVSKGETIELALRRESIEEIGIKDFKAVPIAKYVWESDVENEPVYMFVTQYSGKLSPDPDEVDEGKFWEINEIESGMNKNIFTPNFVKEYQILKNKLIVSLE